LYFLRGPKQVRVQWPYQGTRYPLSMHSPASTPMSRLPSDKSTPSSPTVCLQHIHLTLFPHTSFPCSTHLHNFSPCLFLRREKPPPFQGQQNPCSCVLLVHSVVCESPTVLFYPTVSQWRIRFTLPFLSCFLCNQKLPASWLLGLPPAFTLVSWRRYVPPERLLTFNGLHGVIPEKIEFFKKERVRRWSWLVSWVEGNDPGLFQGTAGKFSSMDLE
jgi:hypothetical protein